MLWQSAHYVTVMGRLRGIAPPPLLDPLFQVPEKNIDFRHTHTFFFRILRKKNPSILDPFFAQTDIDFRPPGLFRRPSTLRESAGPREPTYHLHWRKFCCCSWWRHQKKHFPRYWPFVRGIHRWPVNTPHKGQWRGALMFSLICAWINAWANNREVGDLRRHRAHYDVIVMCWERE